MSFLPVLSNLPDRLDEPFPSSPPRRALWAEAHVHAQAAHDAWWGRGGGHRCSTATSISATS